MDFEQISVGPQSWDAWHDIDDAEAFPPRREASRSTSDQISRIPAVEVSPVTEIASGEEVSADS